MKDTIKFIVICKKGKNHQEEIQHLLHKKGYYWVGRPLEGTDSILEAAVSDDEKTAFFIHNDNSMQYCGENDVVDLLSYCQAYQCQIFFDKFGNLMETE